MSNVPQDNQQALLDLANAAGFLVRNGTLDACGKGVLETLDRLLQLRAQRSNAEPVGSVCECTQLADGLQDEDPLYQVTFYSATPLPENAKIYTAPPDYDACVAAGMMKAAGMCRDKAIELGYLLQEKAPGAIEAHELAKAILSAIPADSKAALLEVHEKYIGLIKAAKCPNCDGSGVIVEERTIAVPVCCGKPNRHGDCCGNPEPYPEIVQDPAPCQWCDERNAIINSVLEGKS